MREAYNYKPDTWDGRVMYSLSKKLGFSLDTPWENLPEAARNAVLEMIRLLEGRGWTREQAYVLCSVAVDLRVSNVVDVPNVTVSALLPEDIFT